MPARRASPRVRFSISCLDSEWERIREAAQRRGVWINEHVISAGLTVALGPEPPDAPVLALSEAEQRRLLERVDRLAESMLAAAGRRRNSNRSSGSGWSASRRRPVERPARAPEESRRPLTG